jgi:hypothetical protein
MENWIRIGDDEKAAFGTRDIIFPLANGSYTLSVNDENQTRLACRRGDTVERWEIFLKETNGADFRLSGMTRSLPGSSEGGLWFDLVLNARPVVSYWGDGALIRKDEALAAE